MRIFSVLLWILFPGCWAVTGPGAVRGSPGGSVAVRCRYRGGFEDDPKFWCREGGRWRCSNGLFIVETSGSEAEVRRGRVSIQDNHTELAFTVTVENLTRADAGTYQCGVERFGRGPRATVELTVSPGCWAVTGPGTAHGQLGGLVSVRCQYGAGYEAYPKFWCRRKVVLCFNHLIFETKGSEAEETWGRVSIRDNHTQRVITVTLENLTRADAGTYLCGVARIGLPNPRDSVKVIVSPAAALPPSIPMEKAPQTTDQPAAPAFTRISTGNHVSSSWTSSSNSSLDSSDIQAQSQPNILYPLFLIVPVFLCIVCAVIWVSIQYRRNSREMVPNRHAEELPLS
ncbi:unnamed protein product [Caretta caretta]